MTLLGTGGAREGTTSRRRLRLGNAGSGRLGASSEGVSIDTTRVESGRISPVTSDVMRLVACDDRVQRGPVTRSGLTNSKLR